MVRVNHDPESGDLEPAWSAPYNAGSEVSEIRLGEGSGSTPTLMGTGRGQDKFVVITDGQDLMHLDLFWRNGVPNDWKGLGGESTATDGLRVPGDVRRSRCHGLAVGAVGGGPRLRAPSTSTTCSTTTSPTDCRRCS